MYSLFNVKAINKINERKITGRREEREANGREGKERREGEDRWQVSCEVWMVGFSWRDSSPPSTQAFFLCTHLLYVPSFCFRCMRLNFPGFVRRGHCRRGIETLRTLPNCKLTDDLTQMSKAGNLDVDSVMFLTLHDAGKLVVKENDLLNNFKYSSIPLA